MSSIFRVLRGARGGQRASVGRTVLVFVSAAPGGGLKSDVRASDAHIKAGMITGIIQNGGPRR